MRKAVSLLELVIAIVVMGIAVMSLPMILTQTQNNDAIAMQQEAILSTKTKMGFITSYMWDENSWDSNASISRILDTTNSTSGQTDHTAFDTATIRRTGNFVGDARRRLWNVGNANREPDNEQSAQYAENDIDDFNGRDDNITLSNQSRSDMDYLFGVTIHSTVQYLDDYLASGDYVTSSTIVFDFNVNNPETNSSRPTNIKMITLRTTSVDNSDINITLNSFASNIGQSKILKREW